MVQRVFLWLVAAGFLAAGVLASTAKAGNRVCLGDCNGDGRVEVAELVSMVNIALGRIAASSCEAGDGDRDGSIGINELVGAVNNALEGCGDITPLPFKHRISHPSDRYFAFPATFGSPQWVKFTIRVDEPELVYYQNSAQTPFHHDFVSASLEGYRGWSPAEIDAVSLHAAGQELVFGAVLYSPIGPREIAIQLVRRDPYTAAETIRYFNSVRDSIDSAPEVPILYFPTFEQQASADEHSGELRDAGIEISSTARWLFGDVCYTYGWAYGRVVFVPAEDIENAYEEGTLRPQDILLTDGIPAEIPFVAGVLSMAPSTPSSHVAILAEDWGAPFAFLAQEESVAKAESLIGRDIVLRASTPSTRVLQFDNYDFDRCQVRMVDVTDSLDGEVVDHLLDLKRAPDLEIRAVELAGTYFAEVDVATPSDIVRIGGKAANYGFLLREIPDHSRQAIAITFDLWRDYLAQPMPGETTLGAMIDEILAPFDSYPPADFSALFDALDDVRDLIDDEADFTAEQRTMILAALERFDPTRKIRFRSSTNVEDSDVFTGAGLYESESGCVADDVDDDDDGPSICDAEKEKERGVFRALRKVFKSFYNDNAYLERLRHRVDEAQVGMAVLVHHSFPDETELANGVVTLRRSVFGTEVTIVTQPDAYSVTNPEDGGLPEVVDVFVSRGGGIFPNLRQATDRLPLGATVMTLPDEYTALTSLILDVAEAFGEFHGDDTFNVEFEFKKIVDEGLVVKQVRRIPGVTAPGDVPPVMIHEPIELCTFQGEYADVFANYRLKSRWTPVLTSGPVDAASAEHLFQSGAHAYVVDDRVGELDGAPASWPQAGFEVVDPPRDGVLRYAYTWRVEGTSSSRTMTLETTLPTDVGPTFLPIVFPSDLGWVLRATHDEPVPTGQNATRRTEDVVLVACRDLQPLTERHIAIEREFTDGPARIQVDYYWPPFPTGAVAGYTAPLDRWVGSTVSGLGNSSVSLTGFFSQTYRPEHHNFTENFIFDPFLEEGIDPAVLAEWSGRRIRALIRPQNQESESPMLVLTSDGEVVPLSDVPELPDF